MLRNFFVLLLLVACGSQVVEDLPAWQEIAGRDEADVTGRIIRRPVYRARVPDDWRRVDPEPSVSIFDSKLSLVEFFIDDPEGELRITVHNFPSENAQQRIPAEAQLMRWKRQLGAQDPSASRVTPQAHGGFAGLYLQATGTMDGQATTFLAWSMLLDMEHYRVLSSLPGGAEEQRFFKQMRADYTIKASGPPQVVERHRPAIEAFARSFELIEAIPSRK